MLINLYLYKLIFKLFVSFDVVYDAFEGSMAYAMHANTFRLRKQVASGIEQAYSWEMSSKEINRLIKVVFMIKENYIKVVTVM